MYLAEFDLLRDSRYSLESQPWAKPSVREASAAFFKLERADEELERIKVEVRRLSTYIELEECRIREALRKLELTEPNLAYQLQKLQQSVSAQFVVHRQRFSLIEELEGFSGATLVSINELDRSTSDARTGVAQLA